MIWDAAAVTTIFDDPEVVAARAAVLAAGVLSERTEDPDASEKVF